MRRKAPLIAGLALAAMAAVPASLSAEAQVAPSAQAGTPSDCHDFPISSALITPASCWITGPTSVVVAGSSATNARNGSVVAVDEQRVRSVAFAASGSVRIKAIHGRHACLSSASGSAADLDLDRMQSSALPTPSCGAANAAGSLTASASGPAPAFGAGRSPATAMASSEVQAGAMAASSGPPAPAASYYVWGAFLSECPPGATTTCRFYVDGANEPAPPGGGLVVLDFGAPCVVPGSTPEVDGTELFITHQCTPDSQLLPVAQSWINGYESTHGTGTPPLILGIGTNNSVAYLGSPSAPDILTATQMNASAQAWFSSVVQPLQAANSAPAAPITFWGASDIEESSSAPGFTSTPDWYGPTESVAWVDGYGSAAAPVLASSKTCGSNDSWRMADYGDDVIAPGSSAGPAGWTAANIYHAAWGAPADCAVPEIYVSAQAKEWAALAANAGQPAFPFMGPMSLSDDDPSLLSPTASWNTLAADTGQSPPYLTVIGALFPSVPNQPTGVWGISKEASAQIYWSPPGPVAAGEGSPITGYTVTALDPNGVATKSVTVTGLPPATSATVSGLTDFTSYTFTVAATNAEGTGAASSPSDSITPGPGTYHSEPPVRLLDTRSTGGPIGPQGYRTVQVAGASVNGVTPVPVGAAAVVLNVTVTGTTAASYLTLYPAGTPQPLASNLNWTAGQTVPNLVEIPLGQGGQVTVYNSAGSTNVILDVQGYVAVPSPAPSTSGLYNPIVPHRILDTRPSSIGQHGVWTVTVAGSAGGLVPSTGASAVVLNVTATNPSTSSYLTVWPHGQPQPVVSNLNFVKGQTVPNRVIVALGSNGQVDIYNSAGSVQVVVDVNGWFSDGTTTVSGDGFLGTSPVRLLDTRSNGGPLGKAATRPVQIAGVDGVPQNAKAIVANVTATGPTAASYLTVWPAGNPQPVISDLNWVAGETVPNLVVVQVGPTGAINLYNSAGSVNVIIDLVGWYSG